MKKILFFLFFINITLFAQGSFTTEWTSPVCYLTSLTQAETNNNIYDIILYQPPFVKVYDGATKNMKYQFSNPDTSYFYYASVGLTGYRFDVNQDNNCEILTVKFNYNTSPVSYTLKVLNGTNGTILYQETGLGTFTPYVIDVDGDGYLEIVITTGSNYQYTMKIISTTANAPIGVQNNSNTVQQYKLGQNYPNPFNPSTTIEYSISKNADVNINIYNELGQLVKGINEGSKKSGSYKVVVDCSDLASGVYFYELISDGIAEAKKMVLVK